MDNNHEIYLDAAATTKPKPEVVEVVNRYLTEQWYNPSALYKGAVNVRNDVERARATVAEYINAEPDEIIFTSGGSESNSLAILGFVNQSMLLKSQNVCFLTTPIEHKSILLAKDYIEQAGYNRVREIGVDRHGFVEPSSLVNALEYVTTYYDGFNILVSIQMANNEIGTIQDIKTIAEIVHKYRAFLHVDAVQAFGHIDIDVKELGVDMLSASGHKIGAPKGSGFLYVKKGVEISPIIFGTQERGMRGGTENVPYIMGLEMAIGLTKTKKFKEQMQNVIRCRDRLIDYFNWEYKGCVVNGSVISRLPNNVNVTLPNKLTGEALIHLLSASKICISAGSACNSHSQSVSHVLKNIYMSDSEAMRTIRITLPDDITTADIDKFICEIEKAVKILDVDVSA